jgi:hypothetical protein
MKTMTKTKLFLAATAAAFLAGPALADALPTPPAGKGQVVFFRPSGMGMAMKCTVRENGVMVGRVGNARYYVITAEPGTHTYTTKTEATDTVSVQVEPDETTFVKCKIAMGVMAGRPNLSPSNEGEFKEKADKMKPMEADKIAAEIAEDAAKMAAKK